MKKLGVIKEYKFNLKISIALVLFLAMAILVFLFCYYPNQRNIFVFVASLAGGGGTIYSAFYVGQSIKESIRRDIIHRSFEVMQFLSTNDIMRVRSFLTKGIKDDIAPSDLYNKITDDDELEHAVKTTLNHLEMISLQIQEEYIDESIAMLHLIALVKYVYKKLEPYISELRIIHNDKLIYIELEKLALAWNSGKSLLSYPKTSLF